jgi:hypothetical protein
MFAHDTVVSAGRDQMPGRWNEATVVREDTEAIGDRACSQTKRAGTRATYRAAPVVCQ